MSSFFNNDDSPHRKIGGRARREGSNGGNKNNATSTPGAKRKGGGYYHSMYSSEALFPGKLHDMIDYAERHHLESIICWTPDGQAFYVHDPDRLVEILPLFFGQTKYRSFHRQMNMWSFERLLTGRNKNAFHHPYFMKGQKSICQDMTRDAFKRQRLHKYQCPQKFSGVEGSTTTTNDDNLEKIQHNISILNSQLLLQQRRHLEQHQQQQRQQKQNQQRYPKQVSGNNNIAPGALDTKPDEVAAKAATIIETKAINSIASSTFHPPASSIELASSILNSDHFATKSMMQSSPMVDLEPTPLGTTHVITTTPTNTSKRDNADTTGTADHQQPTRRGQQQTHFHEGDVVQFEGRHFHFLDISSASITDDVAKRYRDGKDS